MPSRFTRFSGTQLSVASRSSIFQSDERPCRHRLVLQAILSVHRFLRYRLELHHSLRDDSDEKQRRASSQEPRGS